MSVTGYINSFESFGLVDGPGIRFVVFLKGCAMRCKYCHNPDTWNMKNGDLWTAEEVFKEACKYKSYWKDTGGITASGGEPLLQIDFLLELFKLAKENEIHTAIDTAGQPFRTEGIWFEKFKELIEYTDLFILDIKEMNDNKHRELTGVTNSNILELAKYLSDNNKSMWIRHVLVPDITDSEEHLTKMKQFIDGLKTVERVEILPYHTLGVNKWIELGKKYPFEGVLPPTEEQIKKAESILGISK